ncbi:MAG: substrate-binding domain-containing protein [Victivallales bacterium]|nr:substrate-binding domain-containing protein [Victivallales bacterium]
MPSDFKKIAKEIADGIKNGIYTETLPSIASLSKQFDICPATVKRVLAVLQDWKLVSGEHGRCVRINPKAEGNMFFHKNIVILASLYAMSIPYFEKTLTELTDLLSKVYITAHLFFTSEQVLDCNFMPDCILAVSNTSEVMLEALLEKYPECPVVRFFHSSTNYPSVSSNNQKIGYEAIRHLADDCGHRHIGIIATQLRYKKDCFCQRYDGALKYAAQHPEIKLSTVEVPELEMYSNVSFHQMECLMKMDPEITAVFALSDILALGVYAYTALHNLRIPDDLAVIGCDNENFGKCLVPPLSTFTGNCLDSAQMLNQKILDALQGKKPMEALLSDPILFVKESTRKS